MSSISPYSTIKIKWVLTTAIPHKQMHISYNTYAQPQVMYLILHDLNKHLFISDSVVGNGSILEPVQCSS
jgi:DNA-binding PadR family transcriptional regulator